MGFPRMVRSCGDNGYRYAFGSAAILDARSDCFRWLWSRQLSAGASSGVVLVTSPADAGDTPRYPYWGSWTPGARQWCEFAA